MKQTGIFLLRATQFIISLVGDMIVSIVDACAKQQGFNAEFGSERLIASRFNTGFVISENRKLSRRRSMENLIISGPTGSGKSSKIILPTLFTLKQCSILLTDPSGELFEKSSGYLSQYFTVRTLDFGNSGNSCGYNPLARIRKPNDINKIAHLLVTATLDKGNGGDPFWSLSVKTLLQILIRIVLLQPVEYRNMANVVHTLHHFAAHPQKIDELVAKSNDTKLILEYKSLISTPERTLQNIVASAKAALELFSNDPEIAKTTAYDTVDFDELRNTPTVIFLRSRINEQRYIRLLNSIFYQQFYSHVLERIPAKNELPIFVILEECSSMYIELLPLALANCRKSFCGSMLCVQSHTQLKSTYGDEAKNITANCVTKLFLPGETSMEVLREIEALSGKCTYRDEKGVERTKSLVSADEIRILPDNRSLIISGNKPIIKGRTRPYWRNINFKRYADVPPIKVEGDIPDAPIPLFL